MVVTVEVPILPSTVEGIVIYAIGLLILWVIASLPVYVAGKLFTGGDADLLDAMGATLGGALVYLAVYYGVAIFLSTVLGSNAILYATVLALAGWLAVYRIFFRTSWVRAIGIVLVSWVLLLVLDAILVQNFGVSFPKFFPFDLQNV